MRTLREEESGQMDPFDAFTLKNIGVVIDNDGTIIARAVKEVPSIEELLENMIEEDDFFATLDARVEDIETRLRDGTRKKALEWEIDELVDSLALINPKQRKQFKGYCAQRFPKTTKMMRWKVA